MSHCGEHFDKIFRKLVQAWSSVEIESIELGVRITVGGKLQGGYILLGKIDQFDLGQVAKSGWPLREQVKAESHGFDSLSELEKVVRDSFEKVMIGAKYSNI